MAKVTENILYAPLSDYFLERGFFVLSGAGKRARGIIGTSEFGVRLKDGKHETVDILAAAWIEAGHIHSVAVECKLYDTARESAGGGLRQATDYQFFFDEVYIATQAGALEDRESVLRALGIGHMSVELDSNEVRLSLPAQIRNADRFNALENTRQVTPRLALPLVFADVFGLPMRYMDASHGIWVAKDVVSRVQYNAGGIIGGQTYFAINVEFIDDLRRITRNVNKTKLSSCLRALDDKFKVELGIDTVVTDKRVSSPMKSPANRVDIHSLLDVIERETRVPKDGRRKTKPHLTIGCRLDKWNEQLTKRDYEIKVRETTDRLNPVMEVLKACF